MDKKKTGTLIILNSTYKNNIARLLTIICNIRKLSYTESAQILSTKIKTDKKDYEKIKELKSE